MRFFLCLARSAGTVTDTDRERFAAPLRRLGITHPQWWCTDGFCALLYGDGCPGPELGRLDPLIGVGDLRLDDVDEMLPGPGAERAGRASHLELALRALGGSAGVGALRGDFALGVWNAASRELLAARDAFGVRPLYYRIDGDLIALSSRCALLGEGAAYDLEYIAEFLVAGLARPGRTIFAGVSAVAPGTVVRIRSGRAREERYWTPDAFGVDTSLTAEEAVDAFRHLFARAVRQRLGGAGTTWAQLSGGLDSSAVVCQAEALRRTARVPHGIAGTVSYVDSLGDGDERTFSDAVVREYGLPNEQVRDAGLWQDDGMPAPLTDEPQPVYPFYARDRRMSGIVHRCGGRVLLSGHGSDHYLAGSLYYVADWLVTGRFGDAAREVARWALRGRRSFWRVGYRNAVLPLLPAPIRRPLVRGSRVPDWISPALARQARLRDRMPALAPARGRPGRKFEGEIRYLLSTLPMGIDRGVLDESLDVRYPFLYRPLVELGLRLPPQMRASPGGRKWILREAMRGILPETVRTRRTKGGIDGRVLWSLAHESAPIAELLHDPILAQLGCIDPSRFAAAVHRVRRGEIARYGEITAPLALETWLRVRVGRWTVGAVGECHPRTT